MRKTPAPKTADTHPFIVEKPYGEPRFCRGWKDAVAILRKDLENLRWDFRGLQSRELMDSIDALVRQVNLLPPEQGGKVDGILDPETGTRYRATIVKRAAL